MRLCEHELLLGVGSEIVSFVEFENECFSCVQRGLLEARDLEYLALVQAAAHNQTTLCEESLSVY